MLTRRALVLLAAATTVAGVATATGASADSASTSGQVHRTARVCTAHPTAGTAACNAILRLDANHLNPSAKPSASGASGGPYAPADIQSAYNLPSATNGAGRTVAIVDAYDDPNAELDLATYRQQYGMTDCTTTNGCFKKVNQSGVQGSYPAANGGWAQEISLDLDMVSAACPQCNILLVEANSSSLTDLGKAVNTAASLGAAAISNSYGGSDLPDSSYGSYYNHSNVAITASTGDNGYGVEFPASSHYVTAVGGTSLTKTSSGRGWAEKAWSGAGSGCSRYNTAVAPSSANTGCSRRATADVSAVADPNTGVLVYDSYAYQGYSGWLIFGGTSVSSPIIASVYALAGSHSGPAHLYTAGNSVNFWDVTSGSNARHCSPSQLCTARTGWDGPTGVGTPNGIAGF